MIFPFRHHFYADNKQSYNKCVKLPDDHSGLIRFLRYFTFSGNVPLSGKKQSGNIGR